MHREGYEMEMARKAGKKKANANDPANPDSPASAHYRHRQAILQERLRRREERARSHGND
jgi:hypothetical protein